MTGMKPVNILCLASALIIPLLVSASPSFSDVKIELRNGSSITADECRESGAGLLCSKMGGTFEIEKRDIVRIRTVKGGRSEDNGAVTPEAGAADTEKAETGNAGKIPAGDSDSKGAAANRLEEIRQRKQELNNERGKLIKDREQLQIDIKNAPDWMPAAQHDELNKRNSDLDERIKKFNAEVKELNNEERKISGEVKTGGAGTQGTPGSTEIPVSQ